VEIDEITPASGSAAGGTALVIAGSGFTRTDSVKINGNACTGVVVISDLELHAISPASTFELTGGLGLAGLDVSGPQGAAHVDDAFEYVSSVSISDVSPTSGPLAGGTTLTITGIGFLNAQYVAFDGTPGTDLVIVNDTELTVATPAGFDFGAVNVLVDTVLYGNAYSFGGFTYV
jgi:hypothetical protein